MAHRDCCIGDVRGEGKAEGRNNQTLTVTPCDVYIELTEVKFGRTETTGSFYFMPDCEWRPTTKKAVSTTDAFSESQQAGIKK